MTLTSFKIDILCIVSASQLAEKILSQSGAFDNIYKLSGYGERFIREATHGGRVMVRRNEKCHIKAETEDDFIADFDGVSLYPSAMVRLLGLLKGKPKVITADVDWISQDYYFIEIEILEVGKHRDFPLMCKVDEKTGTKNYTNDMVNSIIKVDKTTLEDLIEFQDVKYRFIRGYYFNEGFNPIIRSVIRDIFNKRVEYKNAGNSLQLVMKLVLNSGYGKLLQKAITTEKRFIRGYDKVKEYVCARVDRVKEYFQISDSSEGNDLYCVKLAKNINDHFSATHCAAQILSMSKRIMNEVMCLAEDIEIPIFYQDTDSMHLPNVCIEPLAIAFHEKYGRDLIGKDLGQFHSDFEPSKEDAGKVDGDILASESIFLGKKCYVDRLTYKLKSGEIKEKFHVRMKGVPTSVVMKHNGCDVMKTFKQLFDGQKIRFNLTKACPIRMTQDYKAVVRSEFFREISFR